MNLTDIYKHKTVKEPFAQILSNNSAITKNSGQRDSDDFKMIIPFALYEPSGQGWRSTEFDDLQMNIDFVPSDQHWSQIKVDDFKINMPFFSASPSAREESENNANFNMDTLSSPNASFEEMIKIGESLEIQQEQEKQEFIQKELYKYMCYFKLETLAPFVSLTEESKINQKLKEEIFDHCNNKLINLQENYQDYITEEQQQQINNIQNIINYFNQNPQIIINSIKNHITKFYGLEQSKEQIKIEIAMIEDELHQEQKLQQQAEVIAVTERALNKEVKIPDKIISLKEYYVCLKNEIMQAQYIFKNILYENQKAIESEKIKNCQNLLLQLESRQKEIIENIENIKEELNTTEQKLQSQIEKDNQLNHSEMVLIKRKDYINLIERNLYQNAQLLDIIESQIKKSQEINLQGIVKDLVAQETVSNNLATTANNLVISTPSASAYSTKNPNIPNKTNVLPIGTKRKIEKKNPDYPNVI